MFTLLQLRFAFDWSCSTFMLPHPLVIHSILAAVFLLTSLRATVSKAAFRAASSVKVAGKF